MNRDNLLTFHRDFCDNARGIMEAKNHDYAGENGDDPFTNFRAVEKLGLCSTEKGVLVRVVDKIKRLQTFETAGRLAVSGEGPLDACLDLVNYAILLAAIIKEKADGD